MSKFVAKETDLTNTVLDMNLLHRKIALLRKSKDENSRYVVNVYKNYIKYFDLINSNHNLNYNKDLNEYIDKFNSELIDDNIAITASCSEILSIMKLMSDRINIVYFASEDNEEDIKVIIDKVKKTNNVRLILIGKYTKNISKYKVWNKVIITSMFKPLIRYTVFNRKPDNIVTLIDIKRFKDTKNWYNIQKYNFEKVLENLSKFDDKTILNDPEKVALESIKNTNAKINFTLNINVSNKDVDIIKIIQYIKDTCNKLNVKYGLEYNDKLICENITNVSNLTEKDRVNIVELIKTLKVLNTKDLKQRYSKIYDDICYYLENDIKMLNYCDFKNGKCMAKRDKNNKNNYPIEGYDSCCYLLEYKSKCENLDNRGCKLKCISCRLFECGYLQERGIGYSISNNLQTRCFLNLFQRNILVLDFFDTKEHTISVLFRNRNNKKS